MSSIGIARIGAERNGSGRILATRSRIEKNDPAAMNRPKHMRQRCRLSLAAPRGAPNRMMRRSPTKASEHTHRWSQVLPGGKTVLFTANVLLGSFERADIVAYTMSTGQRKTVLHGGFYGRYVPTGHLVYMHENTLFAVPFDAKRLEVTGQAAPILEGVVTNANTGGAQFSFSEAGNLVYVPGRSSAVLGSIYWMERDGKFRPLRESPAGYLNPAFSPDGKRLAMEIFDGKNNDIWVYELGRDTLTRLTFASEASRVPVWTPDGQRITYCSLEKGVANLYWKRADGAGDAQRLTENKNPQRPYSWRADGKFLAFTQSNPDTRTDIMMLPWPIPQMVHNGKELFYRTPDSKLMVVAYTASGDSFVAGKPHLWSPGQFINLTNLGPFYNFDLHPDGKRFALVKTPGPGEGTPVNKVTPGKN